MLICHKLTLESFPGTNLYLKQE